MKPTAAARPEIVVATILREVGDSGVQSHIGTLQAQALRAGRVTTVVTPFSRPSLLRAPVFGARLALRRVSPPSGVWWYRHWHARYLAAGLRAHLVEATAPSVIYAQCPVSAAAALRVRTTQPVVMVVHFNVSQADEWAEKGQITRTGRTFASIRRLEAEVLPRLDGLVYVSEFMRSVLEERLPDLRRVPAVVVPNCVDVEPRGTTRPTRDVVTVGSLEPRKNQGYLLEVLAAAADSGHRYSLTVIGDGPDRAALERTAARLRVGDLVHFVGYQADPRALMATHRLYCHASRMENLPIALIEAMAEGLPLLAAPTGGVAELVRPGVNGDVWPLDDPEAAAQQLIAMMSAPSALAAMGARARTRAVNEFASDVQGPRLFDFLDSVTCPGERQPSSVTAPRE